MSTRAIRKTQKQRQQAPYQDAEASQSMEDEKDEEDEEDEEEVIAAPAAKPNLFALLDAPQDPNGEEIDGQSENGSEQAEDDAGSIPPGPKPSSTAGASKKKRKPKNKRKSAQTKNRGQDVMQGTQDTSSANPKTTQPDEIDMALKSLALSATAPAKSDELAEQAIDQDLEQLCALVAIDQRRLIAANEMRQLFGRAALESDAHDRNEGRAGRRRGGEPRQQGLAAATAGHHGPGSGGLTSLSLRRNIFVRGQEDWPRAPGGGLGMEVVNKESNGITEYRFVHNRFYQDAQRQFEAAAESMDPERLVQHLQLNPYHISTLLQVSEIATHERDHATAGDLLERALFSFGRAVHSTFGDRLAHGKARLDFRRPENREFWLAGWRYIGNLAMRATWKTAFEWAKLLFSLDPDGDPYCIRLVIDQMALRSHQAKHLVELASCKRLARAWSRLPNISTSLALAQLQLGQADACRRTLFSCIKDVPWLFNRLFQQLGIDRIPPSVWGSEARTTHERLMTELYVHRAADLWKTPEASSLLVEVAGISERMLSPAEEDVGSITLDEARHVLLSDNPSLVALIPHELSSQLTSTSDPLPPLENLPTYDISPTLSRSVMPFLTGTSGITDMTGWIRSILPDFRPTSAEEALEAFQRVIRQVDPSIIVEVVREPEASTSTGGAGPDQVESEHDEPDEPTSTGGVGQDQEDDSESDEPSDA